MRLNLLYAVGQCKNSPWHHSKSAVCENFDVKIFSYAWIELHTLQEWQDIRMPLFTGKGEIKFQMSWDVIIIDTKHSPSDTSIISQAIYSYEMKWK